MRLILFLLLAIIPLALSAEPVDNPGKKTKKMEANMTKQENLADDFFDAVQDKNLDKVKALISGGLSVDVKNDDNKTVLQAMLRIDGYAKEREEIVNYLIEQGAEVNFTGGFGETLLHEAVGHNMISTVKLLLKHGSDHTVVTEQGKTPLFYASSVEMVKLLVGHKAGKLDDLDKEGNTLLHNAVGIKLNFELVKYLLKHIDINAKNKDGDTALIEALTFDYFPEKRQVIVDYLLDNGADVNITGKGGRFALLAAVSNQNLDLSIIERLVKAGADINQKNNFGLQAVHFAAANNLEYLKYLLEKGAEINVASDNTGATPLQIATINNRRKTIKYLLERGAEVNIKDAEGKTALNHALEDDNADVALMLQAKGAKAADEKEIKSIAEKKAQQEAEQKAAKKAKIVDLAGAIRSKKLAEVKKYYIETKNGPKGKELNMHKVGLYTLRKGNLEIFKYFVDNGLDIKLKDDGYSMLHDAVFYNQIDIARYLIEKGHDINKLSKNGKSVFSMSANSSVAMVDFLIESGVKIDKEKEADIVQDAIGYSNPVMADYFINQGYKFDPKIMENEKFLLELVRTQDIETLQFLLKKNLNIETKVYVYGHKASLLHLAVMIEADKVVEFLLASGANPNARNTNDKPIFLEAINNGNMSVLNALYTHGADVNDTSGSDNQTPLHTALKLQRVEIARMLIERGADVNMAFGSDKDSAMHMAARHGYLDIVKHMVKNGGNVHLLNRARKAPLDIAIEYEQKAVADYLAEQEKI